MTSHKYVNLFFKIVIAFSIFHLIIWNLYTKYIFAPKENHYVGDAGRMSYQVDSLYPRENINTLPKHHINFNPNEKNVDVLTIGDSFSNGIVQGKNPYYQDYIATIHNSKVMNIQNPTDGFFQTILKLDKLGVLDNIGVKHIIIELVERSITSFASNIDFNPSVTEDYLSTIAAPKFQRSFDHIFINRLNYNALIYNILYDYDSKAYFSKIRKFKLDNDYFSVKDSDILLSYEEDIKKIKDINLDIVERINNNFNTIQKILKKKNIKLYFMPAVDKYNLYSDFVIDNKFPKSTFFELIRLMKKDYVFIDTKAILLSEIKNGKKDVYYSDDTHWSYKASEKIVNSIVF